MNFVRGDSRQTHWSHSIYCQTSSDLSFDYLPNRWDESDTASLYGVIPRKGGLYILEIGGSLLGDTTIPSEKKGEILLNVLKKEPSYQNSEEGHFMSFLAENNLIFYGTDANTLEYAIPKTFFQCNYFDFVKLMEFKRHPNYPETVGYRLPTSDEWTPCKDEDTMKRVLKDQLQGSSSK